MVICTKKFKSLFYFLSYGRINNNRVVSILYLDVLFGIFIWYVLVQTIGTDIHLVLWIQIIFQVVEQEVNLACEF